MAAPLTSALLEAKARLEQFGLSTTQGAENALKRYYHLIRPGTLLGDTLRSKLPGVDFSRWYAAAEATEGGMVGTAYFEWPMDDAEVAALRLELIRHIAEGELDLINVSSKFTYVDNHFSSNIHQFYQTVVAPFHNLVVALLTPLLEEEQSRTEAEAAEVRRALPHYFIDPKRLRELEGISHPGYDLTRLIAMARELDFCFRNDCLLAVASLTRALLDHVPPIFGVMTFAEVANNYPGPKSFKESMQHLEQSARRIADAHLHTIIRQKEVLPTPTQVNFSNDLDVLLAEVVRRLK